MKMEHLDVYTDFDDDESDYVTEAPLPTPGGTPYRTPHLSRHTSRGPTPSPTPSSYPASSSSPTTRGHSPARPPLNHGHRQSLSHRHGHDGAFDENISILDPRRFTPTLHANLVAEILSLRRELESKSNVIDSLESDLAAARDENENATTSAATALKEARDAKRQLARAEKDELLSAVAQERDGAVEALNELKKQMERLSKSRRQAEEDLQRMKNVQERDTETFEDTKRALERRAHVAEGRLKAVLDELAAQDAQAPPSRPTSMSMHKKSHSEDKSVFYESGSDTASIRTLSLRRRPMSLLMDDEAEKLGISLQDEGNSTGISLADELDFDAGSESEDVETFTHEPLSDVEADYNNPAEMISDVESEDGADELPEVVDMGIQVVPLINYEEQFHDLGELLQERNAELDSAYGLLAEKTTDLESAYLELDKSNTKISQFREQISLLDSEVSEKYKAFEEREVAFSRKESDFNDREQEVEDRWCMLEERSEWLGKRETDIDERTKALDVREEDIKSRTLTLEEDEDTFSEKEEQLEQKAKILNEKEATLSEGAARLEAQVQALAEKTAEASMEVEEKPREGEYEANARRKRAAGVTSSTPPAAPQMPLYVSVDMQTDMEVIETVIQPPSPPKTPEPEIKVEMQSTGIQTDPFKQPPPPVIHVPGIMVTPPEPTPPLPPPPKPVMKDAGVQTRPTRVRTQSMQTEEIKLDERLKKFAPHLMPSSLLSMVEKPVEKEVETETPAPTLPRRSSKRTMRRGSGAPVPAPTSVPAAVSRSTGTTMESGTITSPKNNGNAESKGTPESVRQSRDSLPRHLFNGVDLSQDFAHSSGDDDFPDEGQISVDEYKTQLSAPRPRRQKNNLNGHPSPVRERFEPGTLRRQPSMRKSAMVSSGVHAHARARSPSLASNRTTESGGTSAKIGPPFPVPIRHSSRRPNYTSDRDLANSPTPLMRNTRRNGRRQSIRKVRSAANLPSTRDGTRSPPPLSTSTVAPNGPEAPPLPRDNITSPAFDRHRLGQSRHRHQESNNTSTTGHASVGSNSQQTSVVDAIAQTMVGEWMWKYVRRRRSFGVTDSPQTEDAAGGQRHKRWVWLAPYERAVMWSSRQPTSGNALLGKSGRKRKRSILMRPFGGKFPDVVSDMMDRVLTEKVLIQSVLDVKDDTPLPKGASNTSPIFNRSILILTPARALKFTAPSRERHYVWLTALSFLSHSAEGAGDGMLALPPPMPFEYEQMQQQAQHHPQQPVSIANFPAAPPPIPGPAPPNAFSKTRDSVHLAKGRARPSPIPNGLIATRNPSIDSRESFSAEPPSIPRFPGHSRRRNSNTLVRPQTRSTSHGYERSMASYATTSNAGSVNGDSIYGVGGIGLTSANSSVSHGFSGHGISAGWEAGPMGTVRMEAFVERKPRYEFDEQDEMDSRVSSYRLRRDRRSSRQGDFWGNNGEFYNDAVDEFFRADDPFRGF